MGSRGVDASPKSHVCAVRGLSQITQLDVSILRLGASLKPYGSRHCRMGKSFLSFPRKGEEGGSRRHHELN